MTITLKPDIKSAAIVIIAVLAVLKFRNQLMGLVARVPVVGSFVA